MRHKDKIDHAVYSFAATTLAATFVPIGWAVLAVVVAGAIKEVLIDGLWRKGTPEWPDFLADVIGVLAAVAVMGRWGL